LTPSFKFKEWIEYFKSSKESGHTREENIDKDSIKDNKVK
jgi:hypothetical protein